MCIGCPYCLDDDGVGVCDDGYIGVNEDFYECDVSTGGGTGDVEVLLMMMVLGKTIALEKNIVGTFK